MLMFIAGLLIICAASGWHPLVMFFAGAVLFSAGLFDAYLELRLAYAKHCLDAAKHDFEVEMRTGKNQKIGVK